MTHPDLWLRLRAILFRRRAAQELDDELTFHIDMLTRKHIAAGRTEHDARQLARARFGSMALIEDQCRDVRGISLVETTWQDLRYALRCCCRAPTFALTFNWRNRAGRFQGFTWPEYQEFGRQNHIFSELFASRKQLVTRIEGHPAFGELVTGGYFRMLGIEAALGRVLTPDDSPSPGRNPVAVLSYSTWLRQFAGDGRILGRTIRIQGYPVEVVGVARDGFSGLDLVPADFWAPLTLDHQIGSGPDLFGPEHPGKLSIIGRLKPAVSTGSAEASLMLWAQQSSVDRPLEERPMAVTLESRATSIPMSPKVALAVSPIFVAFGLVMMERRREIGIRLALGATRRRLVRQLLTESVVLALPAAAAGCLAAQAAVDLAVRFMFATVPPEYAEYIRLMPLRVDARVLVFTVAAGVVCALVFGLVPALQSTHGDLVQTTRGDFTYDLRPSRVRHALVVTQLTASVLLLITAGVLLRGSSRLGSVDLGLRTRDIVAIEIQESARERVLSVLPSDPIVEGMAATSAPALANRGSGGVSVGRTDTTDLLRASYRFASSEFFTVLDVPILSGRRFTDDEATASASVAIVSQTAARLLWPEHDAVGQTLRIMPDPGTRGDARIWRHREVQVIGVARDVVSWDPDHEAEKVAATYLPISAHDAGTLLLVRVRGNTEMGRRSLDANLSAVNPGAVQEIHKLQDLAVGRLYLFRATYWVSAFIGSLALLLTVTGIYGVLS